MRKTLLATAAALMLGGSLPAQTPTMTPDIGPAEFDQVTPAADYVRRTVMIPMRDGTKLFTVIVMKKGVKDGPILLTRTPYNADKATSRNASQKITEILPISDAVFVQDGYIRVYQDVRGRNGSEGDYVMNRPLRGPLNPTKVDHATDAYDTIDWLVKNLPESNGKVAMTGSSYPGFTTLMAMVDPHPALKATVPMSPMVDGWMGDDWFHNGAFRQTMFDYFPAQTAQKGDGNDVAMGGQDAYKAFLDAGNASNFARLYGLDRLPAVRKLLEHPDYDAWWQGQALDRILGARPLTVPTMLVVGQWDQEDSYGAPAVYRALEPKDRANERVSLVIGPWRHSGVNYDGSSLGPLRFAGDTGLQFRRDVMKPFLDKWLRGAKSVTPPVLTYAVGADKWEETKVWPAGTPTPLYLTAGMGLSFAKPAGAAAHDDYVSDPAKPVPFVARPVHTTDADQWRGWLLADQRFVDGRPDVLTYTGPVQDKPVHIMGAPMVDIWAATSGTDSDWVVKLIDVWPDEYSSDPKMAGYQFPIAIEIFRGRYAKSFETPAALKPGEPVRYRFALPNVNHVVQPGHRIMVQIQSSLFPLYDRNPQSFVPSIMTAPADAYVAATQSIHRGGDRASAIILPLAKE